MMKTMKKNSIIMAIIGLILFLTGIYISIYWMVIGTFMGVGGGALMGGSTYFFVDLKKNDKI